MKLSEFKTFIRLYVPGAKTQVIPDATLEMLINHAVRQVNIMTMAYQADKQLNVTAEQQDYSIVDYITDFACMDRSGIWWNAGTAASPDWTQLDAVTRDYVDYHFPTWRNDTSSDPIRYFLEGDKFIIHPKPSESLANGFHVYYIKDTNDMTDNNHYPFTGSTVVLHKLKVLDEAIIDYVRWKLQHPLGSEQKGTITESTFKEVLQQRTDVVKA